MKVRLETGEEAEAIAFERNQLTLSSPKAFAPGAPIRFEAMDDIARTFEGRTIGSKRVSDEAFEVRLRFVNLRRADRELLVDKIG